MQACPERLQMIRVLVLKSKAEIYRSRSVPPFINHFFLINSLISRFIFKISHREQRPVTGRKIQVTVVHHMEKGGESSCLRDVAA